MFEGQILSLDYSPDGAAIIAPMHRIEHIYYTCQYNIGSLSSRQYGGAGASSGRRTDAEGVPSPSRKQGDWEAS